MAAEAAAIETEALTKRYGRHRGIEDVSFAVRALGRHRADAVGECERRLEPRGRPQR